MTTKEPLLRFNPQSGCYEGMLLIRVDPELFRRFLINAVEEDQAADLSDPQTWASAIARVGKITNWLDRPHTTIMPMTTIPITSTPAPAASVEKPSTPVKQPSVRTPGARPLFSEIEVGLRERARSVPPHLWESLRTPIPEGLPPKSAEKQRIYYIRSDEGRILRTLLAEWTLGEYKLTPEAQREQDEYAAHEAEKVTEKIEAVAEAVNGSRLR